MQLERILQSQGFGSRKLCRAMIETEAVTVNGELCDDPKADFVVDGLVLTVDGETWVAREKAYVMLHKPSGYECSHKPVHHPSVYTLLPTPLINRGLQCVGRLDQDTTGLLFLTDDGQFIHRMASPKKKVPKDYIATLKYPIEDELIEQLLAGVVLHDDPEPVAASACERLSDHELKLTITSGRYHQVKRMLAATSNRVEALHRSAIGTLSLPTDLAPGEWRWFDGVVG